MEIEIDAKKVLCKEEYIGGYHGDDYGFRKYKLTLTFNVDKPFEVIAYKEVNTPREKGVYGKWGEGKASYYFEGGKMCYDTPLALLKSKYTIKN